MRARIQWVVAAALVAAAVFLFARNGGGSSARQALPWREIAARGLAGHLAENFQEKEVLVISNPFTQMSGRPPQIYQFEEASLKGIRDAFEGKSAVRVVFPELRPGAAENPESIPVDPQTTTPLGYLIATNAFDLIAQAHSNAPLHISLIGLPVALADMAAWKPDAPQRYGLLLPDLRFVGNQQEIAAAFTSGKIAAAVMEKPGATADDSISPDSDWQKAFADRYVLITSSNVVDKLSRHPGLF